MRAIKDLTGQRFGRLVVQSPTPKDQWRTSYKEFTCLCDCGKTKSIRAASLQNGSTKSCGCFKADKLAGNLARRIDLTGKTFGRLTAQNLVPKHKWRYQRKAEWVCICECGSTVFVKATSLTRGNTKSCGCLARELSSARLTTHGGTKGLTYQSWRSMKSRCTNESDPAYEHYTGRGIQVCERWLNSFESFLEDMGERPSKKHSLDRINNDGNYELGNCRWATTVEQGRNRGTNRLVEYNGQVMCLAAWSEQLNIKEVTLTRRLNAGWTVEQAFETPVRNMLRNAVP